MKRVKRKTRMKRVKRKKRVKMTGRKRRRVAVMTKWKKNQLHSIGRHVLWALCIQQPFILFVLME